LEGDVLRNLKILSQFVAQVYFHMWFRIKVKHSIVDGPHHLIKLLYLLRAQTVEVKDAVTKSIQNGAFHAHSESLLISLLASSLNENRTFAVNMILKIRGDSEQGDTSVRNRKKPTLNFDAVTLLELIDWSNEQILEPNFTCNMTKRDLKKVIDSPMEVPYYPLHTQSCERVVKQVTEAAAAVCGFQRRDGFIRARIEHRDVVPNLKSKKDLIKLFS
jgi:hypothetical protein